MNSFPSSEKIIQEFRNLRIKPISNLGLIIGLIDENNIYRWRISILGPKETPYDKGLFWAEVIFPKLYPEEPPKIIFNTPIYHPNVNMKKSSTNLELGQVAFQAINIGKPSYYIREILSKLYTIFFYPNLDLAYSLEIAKEYKENRNLFENKAEFYKKKYSGLSNMPKKYEFWDFSYNDDFFDSVERKPKENTINNMHIKGYDDNQSITLHLEINGYIETSIKCKLNELIKDIIKKVLNSYGIEEKNDILVIFNCRKIKLDVPLGEYHFKEYNRLTIIYDR